MLDYIIYMVQLGPHILGHQCMSSLPALTKDTASIVPMAICITESL